MHSCDGACAALVVEDHPLYRDALTQVMRTVLGPAAQVCAVNSAEIGLQKAASMPHLRLVLLDPGLSGRGGPAAIAAFRRQLPQAVVVAFSACEDRREARAAFQAGAIAFVSKAATPEQLSGLLQRALSGAIDTPEWVTPARMHAPAQGLTRRQSEVLGLLVQGHSNKEIALRLQRAEVTVKIHVSAIFRQLGVANRTQAVLAAHRLGLHTLAEQPRQRGAQRGPLQGP